MGCNEKRFTGGKEVLVIGKNKVVFHHKYAVQWKIPCQKPKHLLRQGSYGGKCSHNCEISDFKLVFYYVKYSNSLRFAHFANDNV